MRHAPRSEQIMFRIENGLVVTRKRRKGKQSKSRERRRKIQQDDDGGGGGREGALEITREKELSK